MILIGIDQSFTGTGVAIFSGERLVTYFQITSNKDQTKLSRQRFIENLVVKTVKKALAQNRDVHVASEGLAYGATGKAKIDLSKLLGGIQTRLADVLPESNIHEVPPTAWKKVLTGKGNASKDEVIIAVNQKYKTDFIKKHNNIADAIGLADFLIQKVKNVKADQN